MTSASPEPSLSVVLPAHNPHRERLGRTLLALARQSLPPPLWELIVVDNASTPPLDDLLPPPPARIVREPTPGLSHARRAGVRAAAGEIIVFADDDNLLAPDYLETALGFMRAHPRTGAAGGNSLPEFESPPPPWSGPHHHLLALRDLGGKPLFAEWNGEYPEGSPIGAGMVLRRAALDPWLRDPDPTLTDRCGNNLASGGDNDIVLHLLKSGWRVAYEPRLTLTHLIPDFRLSPGYLARLHESMQATWMRVLTKHGCNPWPPIPAWSVPLRQAKAFFTHRAWAGPSGRIAWRGACGHFSGRTPP